MLNSEKFGSVLAKYMLEYLYADFYFLCCYPFEGTYLRKQPTGNIC